MYIMRSAPSPISPLTFRAILHFAYLFRRPRFAILSALVVSMNNRSPAQKIDSHLVSSAQPMPRTLRNRGEECMSIPRLMLLPLLALLLPCHPP